MGRIMLGGRSVFYVSLALSTLTSMLETQKIIDFTPSLLKNATENDVLYGVKSLADYQHYRTFDGLAMQQPVNHLISLLDLLKWRMLRSVNLIELPMPRPASQTPLN